MVPKRQKNASKSKIKHFFLKYDMLKGKFKEKIYFLGFAEVKNRPNIDLYY